VEIVDAFAAGEARNCVNLAPRGLGSATLTVRHLDEVGVLARVLELLREAGLNVEHMQNRIFAGGEAAVATIDLAAPCPPTCSRTSTRSRRCWAPRSPRSTRTHGPARDRACPAAGRPTSRDPLHPDVVRPSRAGWSAPSRGRAGRRHVRRSRAPGDRRCARCARGLRADATRVYVYRQSTPHGEHTGIVCDVTPEAFLDGRVLGHESVQPERVDGLARYLATVPQQVELVSTLHRAGPVVRATLGAGARLPPVRDVVRAPTAPATRCGAIPGARRPRSCAGRLGAAPTTSPTGTTGWRASLEVWARSGRDSRRGVLCVAYPLDGLRLAAVDRRVAGPVDAAAGAQPARGELRRAARRRRPGGVGDRHRGQPRPPLVLPRATRASGRGLTRPGRLAAPRRACSTGCPRARGWSSTRDPIEASLAACDADGGVLFALPAPELTTLIAIAEAREAVPAKSTYFSPKPGSGIFLRDPAGQPVPTVGGAGLRHRAPR
jgi:hypothetical protein